MTIVIHHNNKNQSNFSMFAPTFARKWPRFCNEQRGAVADLGKPQKRSSTSGPTTKSWGGGGGGGGKGRGPKKKKVVWW